MRIRKKKWAEPELAVCDFFVKNPEEHAGKWNETFNNGLPIYLEIGCGKGGFADETLLKFSRTRAKQTPILQIFCL